MYREAKERSVIWVYELCSNETGELRTVLSRKFINEIGSNKWTCFECIGCFDWQGVYRPFEMQSPARL